MTHLRRHPEQWVAARRYISPDNLLSPVHWIAKEACFAHHPEVFARWQKLDLRLEHKRRVPLLSVCAPEMVPVLVENGAPMYALGIHKRTPMRESLGDWSEGMGAPPTIELSIARRQSDRIQALVAAGWDPAQDPCIRSIRSLARSLFRKLAHAPEEVARLPGLAVLRARLHHHALSARTQGSSKTRVPDRPRM